MNKTLRFFITIVCITPLFSAGAAVQIKKASPVATKDSGGSSGVTSLVPSVIGLVSGVISVNAQQKALSADCIPSKQEMDFVDNIIKEWAKTGSASYADDSRIGDREPCLSENGIGYEGAVKELGGAPGMKPCYNNFYGTVNEKMVWQYFPRTGKASYCKDGMQYCSGDEITVSDTYDLFNLVDFGPSDYKPAETTMAAKLLNKVEKCSTAKINAKKKALWGEFLVNTAGSVGQKTNTGTIMEQVTTISSSGAGGAVGSLGSMAAQFMNK